MILKKEITPQTQCYQGVLRKIKEITKISKTANAQSLNAFDDLRQISFLTQKRNNPFDNFAEMGYYIRVEKKVNRKHNSKWHVVQFLTIIVP